MGTILWTGNGQAQVQIDSINVASIATGALLTVTINGKSISYSVVAADTTVTAATNLFALLSNNALTPPEFQEMTWSNPTPGTILATANTAGTPFAFTTSTTLGAVLTHGFVQPNSSQNDVLNPNNYSPARLPTAFDDFVIANSSNSLLWNLNQFPLVNSLTRWQSFTGTIGLPVINAGGYYEYRPTYLTIGGGASSSSGGPGILKVTLGVGQTGSGPSRERYNFLGQATNLVVLKSGSAQDAYSVVAIGSNAQNTLNALGTSIGSAMIPGETAAWGTINVNGGGSIALGAGASVTSLTLQNAAGEIYDVPGTISMNQGSTLIVGSTGLVYPSITAVGGSNISWISDSNITNLIMTTSSVFDASVDVRKFTIASITMDGDTCIVRDPNNRIIPLSVTVNNMVKSGPFIFGTNRTVKVS